MRHPVEGTEVTLIPERTYGPSGTLRSTSFLQRPDVAIEVRRPGRPIDVIIFDPKYKLDGDDQGSRRTDDAQRAADQVARRIAGESVDRCAAREARRGGRGHVDLDAEGAAHRQCQGAGGATDEAGSRQREEAGIELPIDPALVKAGSPSRSRKS